MDETSLSLDKTALTSYKTGDYDSCLVTLKLLRSAPCVSRVAIGANEALVELAKSGWTIGEKYKETLENLKGDLELGSCLIDEERFVCRSRIDYNQAVILFGSNRSGHAAKSLQQLIASNPPKDIGVEAGLLLAECFLEQRNPEHVLVSLGKIENDLMTDSQQRRHFVAKVRACLIMRNIRRCKKETKSVGSDISPRPWMLSLFKAHQEYLRENYHKAMRLVLNANELAAPEQRNRMEMGYLQMLMNNALGCNYAKLYKFHLAAFYFEKALRAYHDSRTVETAADAGGMDPMQRAYWSVYHNFALAALQAGLVDRAFECYLKLVKVYPRNARLWLRLAECCIGARQKNNEAEFSLDRRRHECVRDVVGLGPHRKIVINSDLSNKKRSTVEQGAMPGLTFEFAYFCLKNALLILPKMTSEHIRAVTESPTNSSSSSSEKDMPLLWSMSPQNPVNAKDIYRLKCSILCALSYVSLCINEYGPAMETAKSLLTMDHLSPLHKLLGQFYTAEVLIYLDRVHDAPSHLSLDPVADLTVTEFSAAGQGQPLSDWYPKNTKTATLALLYNVAVVCNLMGESAKATEITNLVRSGVSSGGECPVLAISQTLYQLIQKGQVENAKSILFRFCPYLQIGELQTIP